ncbi:MAG: hypothetical protein B7Y12_01715 [Rhizobiales bacterium 24-66-13]|jgi:putative spermidine/putrescine transport system permease protein|nr:MAG: hypothetical protein B7Y61_02280 [Rhizobiales bacterium 35-66-30]OYZ82850.1 MAG: hypothetical protein B7Y12_01715 [Rhizobiales bacterium 24-66-13]OZB11396.1 MAG: hypothetical protein B7X67_04075 [Rhizobiales bacterium 39-66-18]HQS45725.1 ABC transporter permease [Xanthobacteraceae bacterium]
MSTINTLPSAVPAQGQLRRNLVAAAFNLVLGLSCALVLGPILVIVFVSFSSSENFAFPPPALSLRWFSQFFTTPSLTSALLLSMEIALLAASAATLLALLASMALMRLPSPKLSAFLQTLFLAPLVFPTIILGLSLLLFYRVAGIDLTFGLILAHVTVALPYAFRAIIAELAAFDAGLSEAAASLGAPPLRSLWHVTLPLIWPGLLSGWIFAFVVSIGELNTSLFLTGPGFTTLPIEVFGYLQFEGAQLVIAAASTVQIGIIVVLFATIQSIRWIAGK